MDSLAPALTDGGDEFGDLQFGDLHGQDHAATTEDAFPEIFPLHDIEQTVEFEPGTDGPVLSLTTDTDTNSEDEELSPGKRYRPFSYIYLKAFIQCTGTTRMSTPTCTGWNSSRMLSTLTS